MTSFYEVPMYEYSNKEKLGHAIGKEFRASLAINSENFATNIKSKIEAQQTVKTVCETTE